MMSHQWISCHARRRQEASYLDGVENSLPFTMTTIARSPASQTEGQITAGMRLPIVVGETSVERDETGCPSKASFKRAQTNVTERVAITFDGRPLEVNHIARLPSECVAGLLVHLAAFQAAIATRLCNGFPTSGHDANEQPPAAVGAGKRVPALSEGGKSSASTVGRDRGMDDATAADREGVIDEKIFLSVKQTAAKIGAISRSTLYHWIESGRLDETHGVRKLGSRWLIDWRVFQSCLERGELN